MSSSGLRALRYAHEVDGIGQVLWALDSDKGTSMAGGANIYTVRKIKIKEDEGFRTYYFYEFGDDEQHAALVAAVNGGKAYIAGATAPQSKWDSDGVKLRSAAISLAVL